jgi:hypothetical protein
MIEHPALEKGLAKAAIKIGIWHRAIHISSKLQKNEQKT